MLRRNFGVHLEGICLDGALLRALVPYVEAHHGSFVLPFCKKIASQIIENFGFHLASLFNSNLKLSSHWFQVRSRS